MALSLGHTPDPALVKEIKEQQDPINTLKKLIGKQ